MRLFGAALIATIMFYALVATDKSQFRSAQALSKPTSAPVSQAYIQLSRKIWSLNKGKRFIPYSEPRDPNPKLCHRPVFADGQILWHVDQVVSNLGNWFFAVYTDPDDCNGLLVCKSKPRDPAIGLDGGVWNPQLNIYQKNLVFDWHGYWGRMMACLWQQDGAGIFHQAILLTDNPTAVWGPDDHTIYVVLHECQNCYLSKGRH